MLGLDVFVVLVKANHVDMVVRPMFKLASSKISTVSVSSTLIKHSPHNGLRCICGQQLIAILDNTDYPRFGCVNCASDRSNVCVSVAALSTNRCEAF